MFKTTLVVLLLLIIIPFALAQDDGEAEAIAIAAAHPAFAGWLEHTPDWHAAAYYAETAYEIWRVQFWDADWNEIGWADVNLERARVLTWDTSFIPSEELLDQAYEAIRAFIATSPEMLDLMESPGQYEIYIDYNGDVDMWGAYLDRGSDSLYMFIDFEDDVKFINPRIDMLYFSNVASYSEWEASQKAAAVAAAFADADVADAVSRAEDWWADAERQRGGQWRVTFYEGDRVLAHVLVGLNPITIVDLELAAAS